MAFFFPVVICGNRIPLIRPQLIDWDLHAVLVLESMMDNWIELIRIRRGGCVYYPKVAVELGLRSLWNCPVRQTNLSPLLWLLPNRV